MAGHGDGSSGSDSTGLNGPDGIYITAQNDLYVAEFLSHRVRRFPEWIAKWNCCRWHGNTWIIDDKVKWSNIDIYR